MNYSFKVLDDEINIIADNSYNMISLNNLSNEIDQLFKLAAEDEFESQSKIEKFNEKFNKIKDIGKLLFQGNYDFNIDFGQFIENAKNIIISDPYTSDFIKKEYLKLYSNPNLEKLFNNLKELQVKFNTVEQTTNSIEILDFINQIKNKALEDIIQLPAELYGDKKYRYFSGYQQVIRILFLNKYYQADETNPNNFILNENKFVSTFISNFAKLVPACLDLGEYLINTFYKNRLLKQQLYSGPAELNILYQGTLWAPPTAGWSTQPKQLDRYLYPQVSPVSSVTPDKIAKFNSLVPYEPKITDQIEFYKKVYLKLIAYASGINDEEMQRFITSMLSPQAKRSEIREDYKLIFATLLNPPYNAISAEAMTSFCSQAYLTVVDDPKKGKIVELKKLSKISKDPSLIPSYGAVRSFSPEVDLTAKSVTRRPKSTTSVKPESKKCIETGCDANAEPGQNRCDGCQQEYDERLQDERD